MFKTEFVQHRLSETVKNVHAKSLCITFFRQNFADLSSIMSGIILQVLTKVNTELQFARAELDEALDKQEGDINEARKRVMWLEDRMGILCGKARLRVIILLSFCHSKNIHVPLICLVCSLYVFVIPYSSWLR